MMRTFITTLLLTACSYCLAAENLRILLTNDDGYDAPGIKALHKALDAAGHRVYVIAPATQQSGAAASVSSRGVSIQKIDDNIWAVDGKPADAVRVGLGYLMYENPPDLVVSGANFGQNTGWDVNISGTVGAAITAHHLGVPAIAVSVEIRFEEANTGFPSTVGAFDGAARTIVRLINNVDIRDLPAVLNVNYPARLPLNVRGVRWAPLSTHSIIGKQYSPNSKGVFVPQFEPTDPHARRFDAESLTDGWVTLTFLDGDSSIAAKRQYKGLANNLLDYQFEQPTRPAPKRKTKPVIQPEKPSPVVSEVEEPPNKTEIQSEDLSTTLRSAQGEAVSTPSEPTVVQSEPKETTDETEVQAEDLSTTLRSAQGEATSAPSEPAVASSEPAVILSEVEGSPDETAVQSEDILTLVQPIPAEEPIAEAPETETEAETDEETTPPKKKKPDSWLRRMFDPGSWRQ